MYNTQINAIQNQELKMKDQIKVTKVKVASIH